MPQTTLSASEVSSKIERNVDENALSCVDCRTPPRRASLHPRHHERVPEGFRPAFTAPRPCCCYSGWVFDIVLPREPCDSNSKCSLCPKRGRSCKDYSCTLLRVLSSQPIVTPRMFTPKTWLQLCWAGFMFCLVSQEGNPHSQDLCLSMLFLFFSFFCLRLFLFFFFSPRILLYAVVALGGGKDGNGMSWLSVLNVLSGGVFVAAGFMHLLPEAEQGLRELSDSWSFEVRADHCWLLSFVFFSQLFGFCCSVFGFVVRFSMSCFRFVRMSKWVQVLFSLRVFTSRGNVAAAVGCCCYNCCCCLFVICLDTQLKLRC